MKIICPSIQREFLSSTPLKREKRPRNQELSDSDTESESDGELENKFDMTDPVKYTEEEQIISHDGQNY